MRINEYIKANRKFKKAGPYSYADFTPAIECADGFKMSVQASELHYCSPRNNEGPYVAVEVGYPSGVEDALMPYVEDAGSPTESVYAQVPVEIVDAVIERHGGIVGV